RQFDDVVQSLTALAAASHGTAVVESDGAVVVFARLRHGVSFDALPVVSPAADDLTHGGGAKPLYADGLEQTIDATRGHRVSLVLTEIGGGSAVVTVALYES